ATVPVVNSVATVTTSSLAVGDHQIVASYQAGTAPGPFDGASSAFTETIAPIIVIGGPPQDFSISIAQPAAQIRAGESFTTQITLTPVNGLTGEVITLCAGAPVGSTCTVTPDTANLDGNDPVTATLVIATTGIGSGPTPVLP